MTWSDLPGWFDFEDLYAEAVERAANFDVMVEVGVGFGRSLAYLARQSLDRVKKLRIYGVDPLVDDWDSDKPTWGANHAPMARKLGGPSTALYTLMSQHAPQELEAVNLLRCRSVQAARMFDDASVRFVFLDGSHHYEDVAADLAAWRPKLVPGGILAGHDHTPSFPGVLKAVAEAFPQGVTQRGASFWVEI